MTKEWKIGNTAITWPENTTVTVGLYRKTGEGDPVAVMEGSTQKTVVLDASNPSSTFSGLPVYDNSGVEYTYSVKEIAVNKVVNGTTVAIDTSTHTTSPVTFGLTTITIEETAVGENTDTTEGAAPLAASITNTLGDISLKVIKVEKGTTTQLNGAKFQLTKKNDSGIYEKFINDGFEEITVDNVAVKKGPFTVNGETTISGLLPGDYRLNEAVAPAGYIITIRDVDFTINADGTVTVTGRSADNDGNITYSDTNNMVTFAQKTESTEATVTVQNEAGAVLPATGGIGTTPIYAAGIALILLALAIFLRKKYNSEAE